MPGRFRGADAVVRVLDARRTPTGRHRAGTPPRGTRPAAGLPRGDLLRRHRSRARHAGEAGRCSTTSISSTFDDEAMAIGQRCATRLHRLDRTRRSAAASCRSGRACARRPRALICSGVPGTPSSLGHVRRPLGRAHPHHRAGRIAVVAPPRSRTYCARTSSHTCSESTITPSRSKTTASITTCCNPCAT